MRIKRFFYFRFLIVGITASIAFLSLAGCGRDMAPQGPEPDAIDQYLEDNPEALEYGSEEDAEPDDDGGDGS